MKEHLARVVLAGVVAVAGVAGCDSSTDDDGSAGAGDTAQGSGGQGGETAGHGGGGGACPAGSMSTADCPTMCEAVVAAACPQAPTQQQCEADCAQLNAFVAMCPAWGGVVDCMGAMPTFTCISGESVPEGCEEEFYCLSLCFE